MQDQKLHEDMQLLARKVVEQAKECFDVTLDYSEESLVDMNQILSYLYEANVIEPLPENDRARTTMIFGAYLGEVFRRNIGGDWVKEWHPKIGEYIFIKK
ncbi:MAG TPA: hypothetical protein VHY08_09455, partial [Bacillota bacterium]|nr:hypothetical protein [Bacillota bacterium]